MSAKLYVVAASHPCFAVARALKLKAIPYRRVEWPPALHVLAQRLRFGRGTVPGLVLEGVPTIGSRAIMRRLEEFRPEPALFPADIEERAAVEEAERFGDQVLQALARRLTWWMLRQRPRAITTYAEDSRLPLPDFAMIASTPLIVSLEWRINGVSDERARADVGELAGHLDRIDAWIEDETLAAGRTPSAADLQIGSSLALLNTFADLRPLLAGRACLAAALREFPYFPGLIPADTLPAAWLQTPASA